MNISLVLIYFCAYCWIHILNLLRGLGGRRDPPTFLIEIQVDFKLKEYNFGMSNYFFKVKGIRVQTLFKLQAESKSFATACRQRKESSGMRKHKKSGMTST